MSDLNNVNNNDNYSNFKKMLDDIKAYLEEFNNAIEEKDRARNLADKKVMGDINNEIDSLIAKIEKTEKDLVAELGKRSLKNDKAAIDFMNKYNIDFFVMNNINGISNILKIEDILKNDLDEKKKMVPTKSEENKGMSGLISKIVKTIARFTGDKKKCMELAKAMHPYLNDKELAKYVKDNAKLLNDLVDNGVTMQDVKDGFIRQDMMREARIKDIINETPFLKNLVVKGKSKYGNDLIENNDDKNRKHKYDGNIYKEDGDGDAQPGGAASEDIDID